MTLNNKNPFVNMRLQKVTAGILCLVLVGLASCVKQKNCEDCIRGTFLYLKEPICIGKGKVTAIIYDSINGYRYEMYVAGSIPKEYKSGDFIRVRACIEDTQEGKVRLADASRSIVYKLKCIEKED